MENEKFKSLVRDMKPLIENITEVLKMHNVDSLASVSVSTDGYFNFSLGSFNAYRTESEEPVKIKSIEELC